MIKDRCSAPARHGADSDVLRTGAVSEFAKQSFGDGPRNQQGLGAEGGLRIHQAGILAEIAGEFSDNGIVEARDGYGTGSERFPMVQVVPEMQVKI